MRQKLVYDFDGAVFWDEQTGMRRWNQIALDRKVPADSMYQVVALQNSVAAWCGVTISYAVVDDFGNLRRVA